MPHISKKLLERNKFIEINKQLYKNIQNLVRSGKTKVFFDEVLTKTEKIMLAKRLAMIVMIDEGETSYAIENILQVSPSTVARISDSYEIGKYDNIIKEIKLQKSFQTLIKKIIPPRVGRDRFKHFLQF